MQLCADSEQEVSGFKKTLKMGNIPAIYSKPRVSDGSGQRRVCINKENGDLFPSHINDL